ncbi:putative nucleic-acid-binding Zn-ribbon protein [Paenibacillus sp. PastF-3]|uniref:hypothetical protein n=1 Tax=unclassified Paenibacillus TaxID=185978 RepID=UPI002474AF4B|nr:hypothetical protein [Paenibacillus sp. PastF-3]MDH6374311.1 putative nucleic-acid-binding Zn-ribbon protein [Paenibacillus sp. PastF-3]
MFKTLKMIIQRSKENRLNGPLNDFINSLERGTLLLLFDERVVEYLYTESPGVFVALFEGKEIRMPNKSYRTVITKTKQKLICPLCSGRHFTEGEIHDGENHLHSFLPITNTTRLYSDTRRLRLLCCANCGYVHMIASSSNLI